MVLRFEFQLTPTVKAKLRKVAAERKRSQGDTLRVLMDEEHARLVASRGEVDGSVPTTKRGE